MSGRFVGARQAGACFDEFTRESGGPDVAFLAGRKVTGVVCRLENDKRQHCTGAAGACGTGSGLAGKRFNALFRLLKIPAGKPSQKGDS